MKALTLTVVSIAFALAGCSAAAPPPPWSIRPTAGVVTADPPADYVVIAPAAHEPALAPLFAHRRAQGHRAAFVSLESIAPGGPDAVLARVRELHQHGLRHLLLVGDPAAGAPALPGFEGWDPELHHRFLSDQPYALDGAVAVGRVPAPSPSETARFVAKLLAYEAQPPGDWQRRVTVLAGPANFGALADTIIEAEGRRLLGDELPADYDLSILFAKLDSPYAYRPDRLGDKVVSELERGALLAVYVGHGAQSSFDHVSYRGASYEIAGAHDFARLHIPQGQPFFVSLTCSSGQYQGVAPSVAEQLVLSPGGPVAVFAASADSHPYANALFGEAFLHHFFGERPATLGDGIRAVRATVAVTDRPLASLLVPGDLGAIKQANLGMYNLFGDPATRLRYPEAAAVRAPALAQAGEPLRIEVEAAVPDGTPVTITIERERGALAPGRVLPHELDQLPLEQAFAAMEQNHRLAHDKVLARGETTALGGRASLALAVPDHAGRYLIKALVLAPSTAHVGSTRFEVTSDAPRADSR